MIPPGTTPEPSDDERSELAWTQEFLARRLAFPAYCATKSFEAVTRDFSAEAGRIERLCAAFTPETFNRRVALADRFDSDPGSGNWSAAMVVEHLVISGELLSRIAEMIARDESVPWRFDADAVKPRGDRGLAVMQDFRNFAGSYASLASEELGESGSARTHEHPQHGPLDLHRWHCFAAVHLRRHRRQLAAIKQKLDEARRAERAGATLLEPSTAFHPAP